MPTDIKFLYDEIRKRGSVKYYDLKKDYGGRLENFQLVDALVILKDNDLIMEDYNGVISVR